MTFTAKCNINAKWNKIDAKCNKSVTAKCNSFLKQNEKNLLTKNVITQNVIITIANGKDRVFYHMKCSVLQLYLALTKTVIEHM